MIPEIITIKVFEPVLAVNYLMFFILRVQSETVQTGKLSYNFMFQQYRAFLKFIWHTFN
jgi:hypothetical protein